MSYRPPILLLAAIAGLTPLAVDMYLPSMPGIAESIDTSITVVQNSLSIFLVGFGLGMLLFGPLSDRFGRRPLALFGLTGVMISSLLISSSDSAAQFLAFRFMQGLLGSAGSVVIPAIVRDCYGKDTARGMSSVMMIMLLAPLVAPLLGSFLLILGSWRTIFHFQALNAAVLLLLTLWLLKETRPAQIGEAPRSLLSSFFRNYRIIFSRRQVYFDLLTSLFSSLAFFTYLTSVAFIYISWFGVSETRFGILFACSAGALIAANFINMRLVSRLGARRMLAFGLATAMTASLLLIVFNLLGLNIWFTVACFTFATGGLGMTSVNADSLVLIEFPEQASSASAVIGTQRFGSGALAGPLLAWMYTGTPVPAGILMVCALALGILAQVLRLVIRRV